MGYVCYLLESNHKSTLRYIFISGAWVPAGTHAESCTFYVLSRYLHYYDDNGSRRMTPADRHRWGRACVCFFGSDCCTTGLGLRVLRSCIHVICFVYWVLFTGCMYVTIIGESSPCMSLVISGFTAASYLVLVCTRYAKPSQSARFDSNIVFWFYISNKSTRETREDSVISAPRTLETHEDSVVSVLCRTLGLGTSKWLVFASQRLSPDDY